MQDDFKGTGTLLRSVSDEAVDAEVWPEGSLEVLSQVEAEQLRSQGEGGLYPLIRRCMLAVLNSGAETDDARAVLRKFRDFEVGFIQQDRGLKVSIKGAPSSAFVDGTMIRGFSLTKVVDNSTPNVGANIVFTISLANGYNGYLPTPKQHALGGYTTWPAVSSHLAVNAEPEIRAEILRLLNGLK